MTTTSGHHGEEPPRPSRRLRARRIALGGLVLIMFALGWLTAPKGIGQDELDDARADVAEAERQVRALELALRTRATETPAPTVAPEPEPTLGPGRVYVVQTGDTLRGIAQTFCGDADLAGFIATFNEIADPTSISAGMEIEIPRDCEA